MANTFHKILNSKTSNQFKNELIEGIQKELYFSAKNNNNDIFSLLNNNNYKSANIDLNLLLKCYAFNAIINKNGNIVNHKKNSDFIKTTNENYLENTKDNFYYRVLSDGSYKIDEEISRIHDDGTYDKYEKNSSSRYRVKKTYNVEDTVISIQIVDTLGQPADKQHTIMFLGMRQEFAQKFKYSGFSGNSSDIFATIANMICAPVETGFYMDKNFHLYRWCEERKCFIRNLNFETNSPLLTDYEFASNQKVIRKDYIGT